MAEEQDERTEEATQQRRDDFRKRGQVAQTRELASVLTLLGSALAMWLLGRFFLQHLSEAIIQIMGQFVLDAAHHDSATPAASFVVKKGVLILAPLLGIYAIMSIASTVAQVGLLNNEEALQFDLEKINPLSGLQRIFSLRALIEGVKSVFKLILIVSIVAMMMRERVAQIPMLVSFEVNQLLTFTGDITIRLLGGIGMVMAVIAAADYFFQRWDLEKQMRMTKQEVKEEHKSREGDPLIKARIRRIQREVANRRMMADVPKADVVITNPTHIACALRYDPESMAAPVLIAKGADRIAEKIKEIARQNNVPIMENKPLARSIFKSLKIGQVIPRELFTAVAQVLSYVYKLKKKTGR